MDASMSNNTKAAYSVEVIGFNQTERIVLSSIFGLSARRSPKFLQHTTVTYSPDLYLVDAADTQAVALFKARNSSYRIPAIFIGDNGHDKFDGDWWKDWFLRDDNKNLCPHTHTRTWW